MVNMVVESIERGKRFLVTSHIRPDGDALGSELALYHVLRGLGKQVVVYNQDEPPENYRFLPGADAIHHTLPPLHDFDAAFILDCGEMERVGNEGPRIRQIPTLLNVDHHLSRGEFCDITVNDPSASSTGELLYRIFREMSHRISADAANCLYAAILTDTGGFRYACTEKGTMLAAGELIGYGANPQWLSENIYENNSPVKLFLMKRVLETLDIETDRRIGSLEVRQKACEEVGARPEHTDGLVDLPRSVRGVEVSVLFTETSDGLVKVSLRSKDRINIEPVARTFGGGGHMNAASCRVEGDMALVKKRVFQSLRESLDEQGFRSISGS
ncbi:MAG: bifunctional oligoribonuclease/PAP phosphatase NrnA [Smithellaceae bacterium]|nr:bifunctional oligoribonuclease/PAP phosphatase NrnA [Smithellaceae bacterium]